MRKFSVAVLVLVLLVGMAYFGYYLHDKNSVLEAAHRKMKQQYQENQELRLEIEGLTEEVKALTTERHKTALRLVVSWRDVCNRIPIGKIIGDVGCAAAIQDKFPNRKLELMIKRDPEEAIRVAKEFIVGRCMLVESELPPICHELTGALPERP